MAERRMSLGARNRAKKRTYVCMAFVPILTPIVLLVGLALYEGRGIELTVRQIVGLTFLALFVVGSLAILHYIVSEEIGHAIRRGDL